MQSDWATEFHTVAPSVFSIITAAFCLTCKNMYQFTCTEQKSSEYNDVHRPFQNPGSLVPYLLDHLVPGFFFLILAHPVYKM